MSQTRSIFFFIFFAAIFVIVWLLWAMWPTSQGAFYPAWPYPTPIGLVDTQPIPLSFADLNADPYAWRNRLLRVSGNFTRLSPVVCVPYKGARPRWSLVAEQLKMDAVGLNELIELAPEGAAVTVDGIWRLYEGPVGCGKEPPHGMVWYLEAKRIVAPNPLVFDPNSGTGAILVGGANAPTITPTAEGQPPSTPDPFITPIGAEATPTLGAGTAAPPLAGTPSQTPTPSPTARSAIPTPGGGGSGGSGGGGTNPTPSNTPPPGASLTPTPTFGPGTGTPIGGGGGGIPTGVAGTTIASTPIPTRTPNTYSYP